MATGTDNFPLVVILGATGSGKTALGLELAKIFEGEIIAADSRTIYKGMDISTAKPSANEQRSVPHHLIDLVGPDRPFTVADFKKLARRAIDDIASRNKLPILVGGTGLYIDAILFDFAFRPVNADQKLRDQLSGMPISELQRRILQSGYALPKDSLNPRRLIRVIESEGAVSSKGELRPNTLLIGLNVDREELRARLSLRVDTMINEGLIDEIRTLSESYGWEAAALRTPGFKAFRGFIEGNLTLYEAKVAFVQNDMDLAKRQYTWFKRNKDVHWVKNKEETVDLVTTFLNK